jgi:hypothetical protein
VELPDGLTVNEEAVKRVIIEIKLLLNQRLYERGVITREMADKARDVILKGS